MRRIEEAEALDGIGSAVGQNVRASVTGAAKEALSGTWLGHALHPLLTDVVVGSFTSATLLDLLGGEDSEGAAQTLIGIGIAAYLPTALSGASDWADSEATDPRVRRTGLVHAGSNAVALALYMASLRARRRGSRGLGRALGALGATVLGAGGYLGGHLTYATGVGADQTIFDAGPPEWTDAIDAAALQPGQLTRAVADDTPLVLLQEGERVYALHDRCSHRGCSLSEGELEGDEIVCACHGSRFDRRDGSLRQGPATAPQPAFETRIRDGRVEVRRLSFGGG